MNLDEYFKRIGFHGSYDKLDLATLKLIHRQHIMSIPFENLSIHCGEKIIMDLEVIFNKVVRGTRGGWCFENNYLFSWVLRQMGYDTTTLGSRVFNTSINEFESQEVHLINKVIIDGNAYIADVSFGLSGQIREPLELISGKEQPQEGGVFRFICRDNLWMLEKTGRRTAVSNPEFTTSSLVNRKETRLIHCFTLEPREPDYFFQVNNDLQTDPTSLFTNKSICSLQTPTGFRALVGLIYSEVTFKPKEGVDLYNMKNITEDELEAVLMEKFDVKLQNKMQAVNRRVFLEF
ncbi:arylamine N-acetyltransferase, pineal gland isozyme NAT-10-like [Oreochromis aureus]|uniref:arylamine N-acetyltransferase n=1 Tax=Oreochromis aureus TaxID=47969 RepID=A0A668V5D6_OREAU|nr:arylamine N-acetyltransferase, pineal gland isozyme NAT-10-like [Oreochromis aureus]